MLIEGIKIFWNVFNWSELSFKCVLLKIFVGIFFIVVIGSWKIIVVNVVKIIIINEVGIIVFYFFGKNINLSIIKIDIIVVGIFKLKFNEW